MDVPGEWRTPILATPQYLIYMPLLNNTECRRGGFLMEWLWSLLTWVASYFPTPIENAMGDWLQRTIGFAIAAMAGTLAFRAWTIIRRRFRSIIYTIDSSSVGAIGTLQGALIERNSPDLLVLPCSAKGTISGATEDSAARFCLQRPLEIAANMRVSPEYHLGMVFAPLKFPGDKSHAKHYTYAASVLNNSSSGRVLRNIGERLGEISQQFEEIRTIHAPLLGTGAGGLSLDTAAREIFYGFLKTRHKDASLRILVMDTDRVKAIGAIASALRV